MKLYSKNIPVPVATCVFTLRCARLQYVMLTIWSSVMSVVCQYTTSVCVCVCVCVCVLMSKALLLNM